MKKRNLLLIVLLYLSGTLYAQSIWNAEHLAQVKKSIEMPFYTNAYQA